MKKCTGCSVESNDDTSLFCIKCGEPMKDIEESGTRPLQEHDRSNEQKSARLLEEQQTAQPVGIELLDSIWPEWKVIEQIGKGSFGKVYKVTRDEHGVTDLAAVKIITIPQSDDDVGSLKAEGYDATGTYSYFKGIVDDFINEIKIMVSMKGITNIVSIEDYKVIEKTGSIGWDIFIRMELLTSLNDHSSKNKMGEADVIKLGQDICSALELCEKKNIIHRDIKPENIFISSNGDFLVGDFGIARELEKSSIAMSTKYTPNYMAPEIVKSSNYDKTVDTYSLGLVLFKLLNNNRLPFIDPNAEVVQSSERQKAIKRRIDGEPLPAPINASPQMFMLITKACSIEPKLRFKSASDMKTALEKVENGTFVSEKEKTPFSITKKIVISFASVFVIATIVLGGIFIANNFKSTTQTPGANPVNTPDISSDTETPEVVDSSEEVITALENKRYEQAVSLSKESDLDNLRILLTERLETLLINFRNRAVDFNIVTMELEAIERMNVPNLSRELNDKKASFEKSNDSIIAFDTAEGLYRSGEYVQAINQYKLVDFNEPDYEKALEGVENATSAYRTQILELAEDFAKEENYVSALNTLDNSLRVLSNDAEINQRMIVFTQSYKSKVLSDAEAALTEDGYLEAIRIIRTGMQTLGNDSDLVNAIAEFEFYAPIKIWDLDYYTENRGRTWFASELEDNYGNTQYNVIGTSDDVLPTDTGAARDFLLNGEYSRLEGIIFRSFKGRGVNTRNDAPVISIRCDDVVVLRKQIDIGDEPYAFSIDLTGVKVIRIGINTADHRMGSGDDVGGVAELNLFKR